MICFLLIVGDDVLFDKKDDVNLIFKGFIINSMSQLNPRLTKGWGWLPPSREFFPTAPKQTKSDQSHLGNLGYIIRGHFDGKKIGVPLQVG